VTDSKRLIDLLAATDQFFASKGIESPRRNAEALFAKTLNLPRIELYLQHDRPIRDEELAELRELIRQRAQRVPLQYLIGKVEFFGAQISLRPGLLIPRPETEELVAALVPHIPEHARVLDIGCGTGCISVSIAKSRVDCTVVGVDVDPDAVDATLQNAIANGVESRVTSVRADLCGSGFCQAVGGPFDVVVSNPPYLRDDELAGLEPEVRDHERPHALAAGPSGDECFVCIAEHLPSLLKHDGVLGLEFGLGQGSNVSNLFSPLLTRYELHRDLQDKERYMIGWR